MVVRIATVVPRRRLVEAPLASSAPVVQGLLRFHLLPLPFRVPGPTKRYSAPAISTESSTRAVALAEKLQALDAKMYGAYWCSHCIDQKELFGKQAFSKIQYVECSKDGVNTNFAMCKANDVPGYPSWQIQGKLYPGEQELDELEDLVQSIVQQTKSK
jgi:hypothetical protein